MTKAIAADLRILDTLSSWNYPTSTRAKSISLDKGEEMGRFNMGSTVILLFGKDAVEWAEDFTPGAKVRMGQAIGES